MSSFSLAKNTDRMKALPPPAHDKELEMESRHGEPGMQR